MSTRNQRDVTADRVICLDCRAIDETREAHGKSEQHTTAGAYYYAVREERQ